MNMPSLTTVCFARIPANVLSAFLLSAFFCCESCATDTESQTSETVQETLESDDTHKTPDTSSDTSDIHDIHESQTESDAAGNTSVENTYTRLCDDGATTILENGGKLQNNVWGYISSPFTNYTQCVFYDTVQEGVFGWEWNLTGESEYPSYPRIGFGWNPWDRESATDVLPRHLQSLSSLVVSFEMESEADGFYNTAFDIWLTSPDTDYSDKIVGEIMVWIDATQAQAAGLTAEDIPINSETYDFYKNTTWNEFPYLAFVQKSDHWSGQIDFMPFISYLVENGHLSQSTVIAEIEFGNEIWSGSGKMVVKNFSVSVQ